MSLIISTGSNQGDRLGNLEKAKDILSEYLELEYESNIYESKAVDFIHQPDFLNQVLQFKLPNDEPLDVLFKALEIEKSMGRVRSIKKGPRNIDIDLLFWDIEAIKLDALVLPHPRLFKRSFIVLPLKELPFYDKLASHFIFPHEFKDSAIIYRT
jgi:2-amino-4-hydroxy-6-hydroxymethyldihydropteridine diphosphokinase